MKSDDSEDRACEALVVAALLQTSSSIEPSICAPPASDLQAICESICSDPDGHNLPPLEGEDEELTADIAFAASEQLQRNTDISKVVDWVGANLSALRALYVDNIEDEVVY
jgi:hypothetical protein